MRDIHFDFENVDPKDKFPYNEFLRNLKARLPKGYTLSTTLFSKTHPSQPGELFDAYDYRVHGAICDFVIIMTYDWGWQGGPPMAVSPIGAVRQVVQFAKTRMPKHKIMVGQNLYGFDWTLPYKIGNPPAKAVSSVSAIALARAHNVPIHYDYKAQAATFKYYDKNGHQHEVWVEDSRSVQATMNLIKEEDVRGISYWKIGLMFPQNPRLLVENFNIVKKV